MKRNLFLLILFLLCATVASAGSITQTQTLGPTLANWSDLFTFNQYAGVAPLTSVDITLSGLAYGFIAVENTSATTTTANSQVGSKVTLNLGGLAPLIIIYPTATFSDTLQASDGVPWSGNDYVRHDVTFSAAGSDSRHENYSSSALLTAFSGLGTFNLPVSVDGQTFVSGSSFQSSVGTTGTATVTVKYNFDGPDVPEPATLAVVGSALLGLGALRFRRRA